MKNNVVVIALLIVQAGCASSIEPVSAPSTEPISAPSPYAGEQARTIKALSADEITRYLSGEGMGLAMAAELNHYPGPRHVLDFADDLQLQDAQRTQVEQAFVEMNADAVRLGEEIVEHEAALDGRFSDGNVETESVRDALRAIGALQAELRFVHLNAHLATRSVLTDAQVAHYDRLRGYADNGGAEHDHSGMQH